MLPTIRDALADTTAVATGLEATMQLSGRTPTRAIAGPSIKIGARMGAYLIEAMQSRGGFGCVYRARHVPTGRRVALKVLHHDLAVSPSMVRRFRQEAEALNGLCHPNIVRVDDVHYLADGRPSFAMEWLEGHTLDREIAERGTFTAADALPVLDDLCAALDAAHRSGIVHRDLKASNIMVVPAGDYFVIKLFDFGIAKLLDPEHPDDVGLTSTGGRLGTPHNMAPEQILGGEIDLRTDVYALGVLIFQMLTGEMPFRGECALEVEEQHLSASRPRPSERAPVSRAVDEVVMRCMATDRDERFASASDVYRAMLEACDDNAIATTATIPLRPSLRMRASAARGVAIHARVRPMGGREVDAGVLDRMEAALWQIAEELHFAGTTIVEQTAGAVLAVATLPTDPTAAAVERRRLLEQALTIGYQLDPGDGFLASLEVHCAPVLQMTRDGRRVYVGGELLDVPAWTVETPAPGVTATESATAGLDDAFAYGDVPRAADRRAVIAAV